MSVLSLRSRQRHHCRAHRMPAREPYLPAPASGSSNSGADDPHGHMERHRLSRVRGRDGPAHGWRPDEITEAESPDTPPRRVRLTPERTGLGGRKGPKGPNESYAAWRTYPPRPRSDLASTVRARTAVAASRRRELLSPPTQERRRHRPISITPLYRSGEGPPANDRPTRCRRLPSRWPLTSTPGGSAETP